MKNALMGEAFMILDVDLAGVGVKTAPQDPAIPDESMGLGLQVQPLG